VAVINIDLYKNRKETTEKEKQYIKQYKTIQTTEYTKQKTKIQKTNIKRTLKT
jgi:hypothetical protein